MNKKAFTLVELLIVIAIIALIATLAVLSLSNARAKSRDAKRLADIKQTQTALELFYSDNNRYPSNEEWSAGKLGTGTDIYIQKVPESPSPADGNCSDTNNQFRYNSYYDGASYNLSFCLGKTIGDIDAGPHSQTPTGIIPCVPIDAPTANTDCRLNYNDGCGYVVDNPSPLVCSGTLSCSANSGQCTSCNGNDCASEQVCFSEACCSPATANPDDCRATYDDSCGGQVINSGNVQCSAPQTCGGGGDPTACGCTANCSGKTCGDDGCGGSCGSCSGSDVCTNGTCQLPPFNCGIDTVADADGNIYNTVLIGSQCWMKQNLRVGNFLSSVTAQSNNGIAEKWCITNLVDSCTTYGGLYNWNEVMNYSTTPGAQGLCPTGWHVPTDPEQNTLDQNLKDVGQTCNSSREGAWECATGGTKILIGGSSGLDFYRAGANNAGSLVSKDTWGYYWSSTKPSNVCFRGLYSNSSYNTKILRNCTTYGPTLGFSVRCLKN